MDFYQSSSFSDQNGYYYSQSQVPDQDYNYYSYYTPTQSYGCYEYLPSQPLVAYSPCNGATYTIPASTDHYQYAVYHSEAAPSSPEVKFVEYDPQPYHGGYDIGQTYGKPLPPSDDICYPRSSFPPNPPFLSLPSPSPSPAPAPTPTPTPALTSAPQQDEEEEEEEEELPPEFAEEEASEDDGDNDDGDGSEDGTSAGSVQVYQGVEEYNGRVVNQNPPGYGLEAFDLCENLFGYWPCLGTLIPMENGWMKADMRVETRLIMPIIIIKFSTSTLLTLCISSSLINPVTAHGLFDRSTNKQTNIFSFSLPSFSFGGS